MNTQVMFSSKSDEWATPQSFFEELNEEFHFTLDPCANSENHKCDKWFNKEQNGLSADWGGDVVFCNPPYSEIEKWVAKAFYESRKDNTVVVLLIPARTDTKYFHNYILLLHLGLLIGLRYIIECTILDTLDHFILLSHRCDHDHLGFGVKL